MSRSAIRMIISSAVPYTLLISRVVPRKKAVATHPISSVTFELEETSNVVGRIFGHVHLRTSVTCASGSLSTHTLARSTQGTEHPTAGGFCSDAAYCCTC